MSNPYEEAALAVAGPPRTAARGPAAVALEFKKVRRKHLFLLAFALLGFELAWLLAAGSRNAARNPSFLGPLMQFSMMNAVFMPLIATVVAATVTDVEAKGNMFKQLLTMQRADDLYTAKWLAVALVLAAVTTLQVAAMLALCPAIGYTADVPGPGQLAIFWVSTFTVSVAIATAVQALCLFTASQFIPLVTGVALSFLGMFGLYLPAAVAQLIPSSYYGLLSTVTMAYSDASGAVSYALGPWSLPHLAAMIALAAAVFAAARRGLSRREL